MPYLLPEITEDKKKEKQNNKKWYTKNIRLIDLCTYHKKQLITQNLQIYISLKYKRKTNPRAAGLERYARALETGGFLVVNW